jgi:hypothetical protein
MSTMYVCTVHTYDIKHRRGSNLNIQDCMYILRSINRYKFHTATHTLDDAHSTPKIFATRYVVRHPGSWPYNIIFEIAVFSPKKSSFTYCHDTGLS